VTVVRIIVDDQNASFCFARRVGDRLEWNAHGVRDCHMLSEVTNHAPSRPIRTPISGLETANQNGIISLNGIASRLRFAV
jgi:hypothetical protein